MDNWDINNFTKEKPIGKGDSSEVFIVKNKITQKIYQSKIYYEAFANLPVQSILMKLNEISKLDHPSLSPIVGFSIFNDSDNRQNLVTYANYYESSLKAFIENNHKFQNFDIIRKLASCMAFLHSHNIIHQNLKPSNILLDDKLNPFICDYGFLKNTDNQKNGPGFSGTSIYTPPEIWKGENYTKSSDVYAFSMIIYEIITGMKPFQGLNQFQIVFKSYPRRSP